MTRWRTTCDRSSPETKGVDWIDGEKRPLDDLVGFRIQPGGFVNRLVCAAR